MKFFLYLSISFFFLQCSSSDSSQEFRSNNRLIQKHEPSDEFIYQRMDSKGKFNFETYKKSLAEARKMYNSQNAGRSALGSWEIQGPGNIGGRINTVAVNPEDESNIFVGFANGGIWKTIDAGENWKPVFDEQNFLAIGDIIFNPLDPEIMYTGTGDSNITGFSFLGDGAYKSIDGGESWFSIGLQEQGVISKIQINPADTNIIYAASMGNFFIKDQKRGLYKSIDGGQNWEQVLFLSEQAGVVDFVLNPENPDTLYAAGWDRVRNRMVSTVYGESSKILRSIDAGATWEVLENGLPTDSKMGRIGLDIYAKDPNIIHAVYTDTSSFLLGIIKVWMRVIVGLL